MISNSEIRALARNSLRGNWGMAVLVVFLYMVINGALSSIPFVNFIAGILLSGPFVYGLYMYHLHLVRGQAELSDLFSGFQKYGKTLVLYLLQAIFVLLWTLLLIIPGIIASFRYSMAYFILRDNPEIGAMEAIRQSSEMMKGDKGKLFMLYLSFIGWALLAMLTLGIGLLWLIPYMQTSLAVLYEHVKTPQYLQPNETFNV